MTTHLHYRRTIDLGLSVSARDPALATAVALDTWVGEGGALAPSSDGRTALERPRLTLGNRRPQDTAEGCRECASADLIRAANSTAGQPPWRYEHSAAAWMRRAESLDRIAATLLARRKQDATNDR